MVVTVLLSMVCSSVQLDRQLLASTQAQAGSIGVPAPSPRDGTSKYMTKASQFAFKVSKISRMFL